MVKAENTKQGIRTVIEGEKSDVVSEAVSLLISLKEAGFSLVSLCMTAEIATIKPEKESK